MDIYTVGHSTHDKERLVKMLQDNHIGILVDIRSYPSSKRYPHFNQESMIVWLKENNILYRHISKLGGKRRKLGIESHNTAWKNVSFKNYADYTSTDDFKSGLNELIELTKNSNVRVCYMCAEHHPSKCHRTIVSDNLVVLGVNVIHILPYGKSSKLQEHKLGSWGANPIIDNNSVIYPILQEQLSLHI